MKKLVLLFIAVCTVLSCNNAPRQTNNPTADILESVKDGVFIHIKESYNDPHKVLMPLKMATIMAADKDVIVYMDIHAVELLARDAKDLTFADFESAHTYIKQLSEKGIGVYACPTCLKIAGISPENLIAGVKVAEKEKFFDFTKGRILTLDY